MGRPKKGQEGKRRNRNCLYLNRSETGTLGLAKKPKRASAVAARAKTKDSLSLQALPAEVTPVGEKVICLTIETMINRGHAGAERDEWPDIRKKISEDLKVDRCLLYGVLEKMAKGKAAAPRLPGAGRRQRISAGSAKGDVIVGALRSRFLVKQAARLVNQLPVSPGRKSLHPSTCGKMAKTTFEMKCVKQQYTKTGNRDTQSVWAKAHKAILLQWRQEIRNRIKSIFGTLFVDDHSEFCVLGEGGHHGSISNCQWLAPLKDGKWCHQKNGGEIEPALPRRKAKKLARADGLFGVCAPMVGGRPDGRLMRPLRYRGKVVGMTTWNNALEAAEELVRKLGREDRANVLDLEKNSRPGVWHKYADERNPFKARFGDDWKNHLARSVSMLT